MATLTGCASTAATRSNGRRSTRPGSRTWASVASARMAADPAAAAAPRVGLAAGRGVWVVLPTYNERDIEPIAAAILDALPQAHLLVVDDASPDEPGRCSRRAR